MEIDKYENEDYNLPVNPTREVVMYFAKKKVYHFSTSGGMMEQKVVDPNRCGHCCVTVFQGLFSDMGFAQPQLESGTYSEVTIDYIVDEVVRIIQKYSGPIRLAIKKYVDEKGNFRYAKYIDFDSDKLFAADGVMALKKVVYVLLHICDLDEVIVPSANLWKEEEWHLEQKKRKQLTT